MFFPVFTIVFVPNLTLFYSPCFLFCIFNCFDARHVDNFFRHFPATEIFFSPRIWLFWFVASLCGRVETISIWLFSIFQFCLFFSVFVLFFFVAIPGILCSFWFASIRFFLYKIRYLCKCLPASRCLCFCRASILVFFFFNFIFFFLFRGQVIEAQTSSRHPAYLSGESPRCLCFYLHFTILLLALPISKRHKMLHTFVAHFSVR